MAVSTDMMRTWRGPRRVMRNLLAMGPREDRAIAYLMAGCFLVFIAQWPRLARISYLEGQEMSRLVAYEFLSWMIVWPLVFYFIAFLLHQVTRITQGSAPWEVRLALFWAFLAAAPAGLLYGLLSGFVGPEPGTQLVGAIWLGAFGLFLVQGLRESGNADGS
ncbi:hypothetical protein JQU17_02425 [Ponticoccus sp. SC2-23]|uniref:hypothetical protein n=1 Tax=Alexandriicola marinus TaxID=2081710 RepID=UPI000FD72A8B|nr:hypothetical protein [Alexandriicola marinus]MBM1219038.1 hypothetical protein [Ponticoccus sp. SC6-9]MBM1223890.1 hypothetical protein [Ponticoccus sp. SC6-15]MBM1228852.1 hypothetical protein [Ponticoccus sp. SC6-38]MBM1232856.1 hypothetical protein [Ponticoccus sp. SC6-45]MBM1237194.1 hypothetical protein [Ponticoccus sp. SC6-49]MBM1241867.1 hypothetical protein [Ponticoccus sp. SC2-64]MBM1246380.1 hypothetical protein [Ponticoccus sp. SC6-42]MBM1250858.1 hypothetical protein [Pontico